MEKTYSSFIKLYTHIRVLFLLLTCLILLTCGDSSSGSGMIIGTSFSVGGTKAGLTGTLVLQLNGGNNLTITDNGPFTFQTNLNNGDAYSVTVLSHPDGQTCIIENGSGTINSANVTDVVVVCANTDYWTHPSDLADNIGPDGLDASGPQVAMDDNGNLIMAWWQTDCAGFFPCPALYRIDYRNGSWSSPSKITPTGTNISSPQIAMDNNGNAIIVWSQQRTTNPGSCGGDNSCTQIYMSEYRDGTWTDPEDLDDHIDPTVTGDPRDPQVAMSDDGSAIITWSRGGIFIREYRNGNWTTPPGTSVCISPNNNFAYTPKVAMDDNGNAIIAWKQQAGDDDCQFQGQLNLPCEQLFISEYRNGSWILPENINNFVSISRQCRLSFHPFGIDIAMDNNGNAIIANSYYDGVTTSIYICEYRDGSWTTPVGFSDRINPIASVPNSSGAYYPQVAMNDNGNAIIAWRQHDGSTDCGGGQCWQIYMSEYRSGSWIPPADLTKHISMGFSPGTHKVVKPQVAMDNNGSAIITWALPSEYDSYYNIFKSEYRSGSWLHPANLNDFINPIGGTNYNPFVAMDNNNNAIIMWSGQNGATDCGGSPCLQVYMSVYQEGTK